MAWRLPFGGWRRFGQANRHIRNVWRIGTHAKRHPTLTRRQLAHPDLVASLGVRHSGDMKLRNNARSLHTVLVDARRKLGMSQREFGPALGSSHRTASRWDAGHSRPSPEDLARLAAMLLPVDHALAAEAASHAGETLESLELVAPLPPAAAPLATPTPEHLIDAVVCAAAEAHDCSPRAIRATLFAAFRRARQVGLTVEAVEMALAPPEAGPQKGKVPKRSA
jgi:transcriptional regulator with XRE-family HTH domain